MSNVFVWTLGDVVGLGGLALLIVAYAALRLCIAVVSWFGRKKK